MIVQDAVEKPTVSAAKPGRRQRAEQPSSCWTLTRATCLPCTATRPSTRTRSTRTTNHPLVTFRDNYLNYVFSSPLKPLLNRATQGEYAPGSIAKIVSIITALESGTFEPDSTLTCTGTWNGLGTSSGATGRRTGTAS